MVVPKRKAQMIKQLRSLRKDKKMEVKESEKITEEEHNKRVDKLKEMGLLNNA